MQSSISGKLTATLLLLIILIGRFSIHAVAAKQEYSFTNEEFEDQDYDSEKHLTTNDSDKDEDNDEESYNESKEETENEVPSDTDDEEGADEDGEEECGDDDNIEEENEEDKGDLEQGDDFEDEIDGDEKWKDEDYEVYDQEDSEDCDLKEEEPNDNEDEIIDDDVEDNTKNDEEDENDGNTTGKVADKEDRERKEYEEQKDEEKVENNLILPISEETSSIAIVTVSYTLNPWSMDYMLSRLNSIFERHFREILFFFGGIGERIRRRGLLKNKRRKEIYKYILSHPGSHFREILRGTNSNPNEGMWHLRILEKAGVIKSDRIGLYLVYHPNGNGKGIEKSDWSARFILRQNKSFKIAKAIRDNPRIKIRDLAENLSMPPNTIRYYVDKLEQNGLVKRVKSKAAIVILPEPRIKDLIDKLESEMIR